MREKMLCKNAVCIAVLAMGLIFSFPSFADAQLSGTYIVRPPDAGGERDFESVAVAAEALHEEGVDGPVTIMVYDNDGESWTYEGRVWIEAIDGASAENTITFMVESGSRGNVTITPGEGQSVAIELRASWVTISGFKISPCEWNLELGIHVFHAASCNVYGNSIFGFADREEGWFPAAGIKVAGGQDNSIINNMIFSSSGRYSIWIRGGGANKFSFNSLFNAREGGSCVYLDYSGGNLYLREFSNNILYKTNGGSAFTRNGWNNENVHRSYNCYFADDGAELGWRDAEFSIVANPLFVSIDENDFDLHLNDNSPCRDSGTSVDVAFDFDFQRRAHFQQDMGADEIDGEEIHGPILGVEWDEDVDNEGVIDWNLAYDPLYFGGPYAITVKVRNEGPGILMVTDIRCDHDAFSANPRTVTLHPLQERDVVFTMRAQDVGFHEDHTVISFSDDEQHEDVREILLQAETVDPPAAFTIELNIGWNLISSPVDPFWTDIRDLFAPLCERGSLMMVKDSLGRFYTPDFGFNNIPCWNVSEGYSVKVSQAESLLIVGESVDAHTPIQLQEGWNFVSYFPEESVDALTAFSNIVDVLIIAKDGEGRFYAPEWNFSNMGLLHQGAGYQVKVSEAVDLIWNIVD